MKTQKLSLNCNNLNRFFRLNQLAIRRNEVFCRPQQWQNSRKTWIFYFCQWFSANTLLKIYTVLLWWLSWLDENCQTYDLQLVDERHQTRQFEVSKVMKVEKNLNFVLFHWKRQAKTSLKSGPNVFELLEQQNTASSVWLISNTNESQLF